MQLVALQCFALHPRKACSLVCAIAAMPVLPLCMRHYVSCFAFVSCSAFHAAIMRRIAIRARVPPLRSWYACIVVSLAMFTVSPHYCGNRIRLPRA